MSVAPVGPGSGPEPRVVVGTARMDRRTKRLVTRLRYGDVAIIDHADLDRVAAETLVQAHVAAVVNVAASMSGRYPNVGPLVITAAGIPLLDAVDPAVWDRVHEGQEVAIVGDNVLVGGLRVASGTRLDFSTASERLDESRKTMEGELERFAQNTIEYLRQEKHLLIDEPDLPEVPLDFHGRHVLLVVRGTDYREDLKMLRASGYLSDMRPILVGVDGGADALMEAGCRPDLIIGDFDSVSEPALRSGAALVVHAYADGDAPGAKRLADLGLPYVTFQAPGTSEDIAMLLAFEKGAELIVAVGTHSSMVEFLDKGRLGMASTFLVRTKVGSILVDAKGVSRLYHSQVRKRDLLLLVGAALLVLVAITLISEPIRLFLRSFWIAW